MRWVQVSAVEKSQEARKAPWVLLCIVQEEAARGEPWEMGTISGLSGTETLEAVVRADAPGLTPAGWSGTNYGSAKCKETTNKVWRAVGPRCLSPISRKRQSGQICEPSLLLESLKLEISLQTVFLAEEAVCWRGPRHRSEGCRVKMGCLRNFCFLGGLRLNAASVEGREAISWPVAVSLAACPETEGNRNPRASSVTPVPRINADRVQSAVSLGGSKLTCSFP